MSWRHGVLGLGLVERIGGRDFDHGGVLARRVAVFENHQAADADDNGFMGLIGQTRHEN